MTPTTAQVTLSLDAQQYFAGLNKVQAEALLLRAPPSRCNAESVSAPWGGALPRLLEDRVLTEATHCDFESPTDWICRLACGPAAPDRQAAVRRAVLRAVERWLAH